MTRSCAIRGAIASDLEGIAALLDEITCLHVAALPGCFRALDGRVQAQWMLGRVADNPLSMLLVAEDQGQVVGLVHFDERAEDHPVLVPRRFLKVGTLVVAESRRGQGIGKALMGRAHDWAKARGLAEVELTVYEFNRSAIGLYEGLGYATRARRMVRKLARPETPSESSSPG